MKINPLDPRTGSTPSIDHRAAQPEAFAHEIGKASHELINRDLQDMLKRIDQIGERLEHNLTLSDLRDYKRLVGDFLRLVSRRGFSVEQETAWGYSGQQKLYTTVREIDRQMARLGAMVMKQEEDHLAVVSAIDNIRGMVLDLYT
ncbi:MAG: YaaR family protein [Bacillota bacterium]